MLFLTFFLYTAVINKILYVKQKADLKVFLKVAKVLVSLLKMNYS